MLANIFWSSGEHKTLPDILSGNGDGGLYAPLSILCAPMKLASAHDDAHHGARPARAVAKSNTLVEVVAEAVALCRSTGIASRTGAMELSIFGPGNCREDGSNRGWVAFVPGVALKAQQQVPLKPRLTGPAATGFDQTRRNRQAVTFDERCRDP
jgi:hypothetical protein